MGMMPMKAQSVFEPVTRNSEIITEYHILLNRSLVGESTKYYICTPSFELEYALSLHGDTLVYTQAAEKIWHIAYEHFTKNKRYKGKAKVKDFRMPISKEDRIAISRLMNAATMSAGYFDSRIGFDGVSYYLGYGTREVKVWSPREGSRTYRTVQAMDSLCLAVQKLDHTLLRRQTEVCRDLTVEYKQLYLHTYFIPDKWTTINDDGHVVLLHSKDILSVYLKVDSSQEGKDTSYMNTLSGFMTLWSRELFINQEDCKVRVFLCDTATAAHCQMDSGNTTILTLPRSLLTLELLLSSVALGEGYYILTPEGTWKPILREDYSWWPDPWQVN